MNKKLLKIIQIEKEASEFVKEADEASKRIRKETEQRSREIVKEIQEKCNKKRAQIREWGVHAGEDEITKIQKNFEKARAKMDQDYKQKSKGWVESLYSQIIEGENHA